MVFYSKSELCARLTYIIVDYFGSFGGCPLYEGHRSAKRLCVVTCVSKVV